MILQIRGICGSGKSYAVRSFLEKYAPDIVIYNEQSKVAAHVVIYKMVPVFVLGPYIAEKACGCDKIDTQNMISSYVRHFSKFGHVVFEGLYISGHYPRYYSLYNEVTEFGIPFVFAELDTPFELCMQRMVERRSNNHKDMPINIKGLHDKYRYITNAKNKFAANGIIWRVMKHTEDPAPQIESILDEDTELQFCNSWKEEKF